MQRITITFPEDLFRRAERMASKEGLSVPEVLRSLLTQWVEGAEGSTKQARARQTSIVQALNSHGMWIDRDPDDYLRQSRKV